MGKSDVDEVMHYPAGTILYLIGPDDDEYLRSADITHPEIHTDKCGAILVASDPEGVVNRIRLNLIFRNEYYAKLFVKRAVSMLELQKAQRNPEVAGSQEVRFIVVVVFIGIVIALIGHLFSRM